MPSKPTEPRQGRLFPNTGFAPPPPRLRVGEPPTPEEAARVLERIAHCQALLDDPTGPVRRGH